MACALFLLTLAACPPLIDRGGNALLGEWRLECDHAQRLAADQEVIARRVRLTDDLQEQLIDGRLTLPEAAERLLEINADLPLELRTRLDVLPGQCDADRACSCLLRRVWWSLVGDPRAAEVLARLDGQFSGHLAECSAEAGVEHGAAEEGP
jgi:hypothetical protein